jgi:dipeptide/tripeptide permease
LRISPHTSYKAMPLPQTLPRPLSWRSIFAVVSASMAVVSVGALISRWLVQHYAEWRWVWIWGHPLSMVALIGGLVFALLRQENRRRQAQRSVEIVAECNHHIRNSLQAIMLGANKPEAHWLVIAESVEKIEHVLTEVLPEATDAPAEVLSVSIRARGA